MQNGKTAKGVSSQAITEGVSMYLQITKKCNMTCKHCCYSCDMDGEHGDYYTIMKSIDYANRCGVESISIGGGEPTMHPRFFDILRVCLDVFGYVWLASNGSQTKTMLRLSNIIEGCDFESFETEDYCTCDQEEMAENDYQCYCEPEGLLYQEDKLSIALSTDYFHDPIDERVRELWERGNKTQPGTYELRDVTQQNDGVAA